MTDRFDCRFIIFALSIFFIFQNTAADACSRLLWNTNNKAVVSARTMDWAHQFDDYLFIYPRGIKMHGKTLFIDTIRNCVMDTEPMFLGIAVNRIAKTAVFRGPLYGVLIGPTVHFNTARIDE